MEGIDIDSVRRLTSVPRKDVKRILAGESKQLEVTKSLVNLLHNIIRVGSVPVSTTQRTYFDKHADKVWSLLSKTTSLHQKKKTLESNIDLVLNIAASCPTVDGS